MLTVCKGWVKSCCQNGKQIKSPSLGSGSHQGNELLLSNHSPSVRQTRQQNFLPDDGFAVFFHLLVQVFLFMFFLLDQVWMHCSQTKLGRVHCCIHKKIDAVAL